MCEYVKYFVFQWRITLSNNMLSTIYRAFMSVVVATLAYVKSVFYTARVQIFTTLVIILIMLFFCYKYEVVGVYDYLAEELPKSNAKLDNIAKELPHHNEKLDPHGKIREGEIMNDR